MRGADVLARGKSGAALCRRDPPGARSLDGAQAGRIHELLAASGVSISGLGYYPNPLTPYADEQQVAVAHLRKVISAARVLGVPVVNTFVGRDWRASVEQNWPRFLEVWQPLVTFAEDQGVRIAIENCPMLFTADEWPGGKNLAHTPADLAAHVRRDPQPQFRAELRSVSPGVAADGLHPALNEFAGRIFHVHLKDAKRGSVPSGRSRHPGHAAGVSHPQAARAGRYRLEGVWPRYAPRVTTGRRAWRLKIARTRVRSKAARPPCGSARSTSGSSLPESRAPFPARPCG